MFVYLVTGSYPGSAEWILTFFLRLKPVRATT